MIHVNCFPWRSEVHSRKQTLTRRYARGLSLKAEANPSDFFWFPPLLAGTVEATVYLSSLPLLGGGGLGRGPLCALAQPHSDPVTSSLRHVVTSNRSLQLPLMHFHTFAHVQAEAEMAEVSSESSAIPLSRSQVNRAVAVRTVGV